MITLIVVLVCFVLYIVICGFLGYFRRLSLIVAPLSLLLYIYYEYTLECTGECNIRIDFVIILPALIIIFIIAAKNLERIQDKETSKKNENFY
ncbi:MAG: hypothetical protein GQ569_09630 [Methylococcaceae bacterium]|nr:hypothetical protein [Methylococcaceae bacterium]